MEFFTKMKELIDSAKMYVDLKLRELKLEMAERVSTIVADITAGIMLLLFGIMFVFFIGVWAALFLNRLLTSGHLGFLIVGCAWLIAGLIIFAARNHLIRRPVRDRIIEKVMSGER